ncbi:hypothetical protein CLV91_3405 [Maribacter vaceletii]|uniref:Lipocalin-like protein n=1 Tax=Maribacter vaceletii TaxID=1206816 RepID=A0A495DRQ9_9FLAO|nr:hypothetical protein [Maribacter vaceletii]RKR06445.1 hypothetical protein CLV91_3405 [Maribacter vaceletii]
MRELIALFIIFFGLLSFGQKNQISKSNLENFKSVQEFDSTLQKRINEENLIGVWYTKTIAHKKYRTNPIPKFKDRYSFKKDFSIVIIMSNKTISGNWSLSPNNIITITTISGKIIYQVRYFKDGTLALASSNSYRTLEKINN